jgi:hypothetical protein
MNKEFVKYEEALALKDLGFDYTGLASYSDNDTFNIGGFYYKTTPCDDKICIAPLYQQAFKWFRELGFDSSIYRARTKTKIYCWSISNLLSGLEYPLGMIGERADSYEEAELACLKKLIEITKKKTNE